MNDAGMTPMLIGSGRGGGKGGLDTAPQIVESLLLKEIPCLKNDIALPCCLIHIFEEKGTNFERSQPK